MSVFKRDNSNYKSNSACNYNYNYNYSTAWVTKCCSLSWPAHTRAINKSKGQAENPLGSPRQAQRQTNEMTWANFHKEPKDMPPSPPCLAEMLPGPCCACYLTPSLLSSATNCISLHTFRRHSSCNRCWKQLQLSLQNSSPAVKRFKIASK